MSFKLTPARKHDSPSNIVLRDTVFVSCNGKTDSNGNAVVGWLRGSGNVWQNNRWGSATGPVIPEPPTTNYN